MSPLSTPTPPANKRSRGNPTLHLAPRCGARTRSGCPCRAPAVRGNLRCRMHGGRSTGPRTQEGLARLAAARTTHGFNTAEARALKRFRLTLLRRIRTRHTAFRYQDHLHPEVLARLRTYPPELALPPHPSGAGLTAAQDQMRRRAVAAALLPWKREIETARQAHLTARAARLAAKAADPNARPPRPRRPRPAPLSLDDQFAALLTKLHAPEPPRPAHVTHVPKPLALIPSPTEPAAVPTATQDRDHPSSHPADQPAHLTHASRPHATDRTHPAHVAHVPKPHALIPGPTEPAAIPIATQGRDHPSSHPATQPAHETHASKPHATDRTHPAHVTHAPKPHALIPGPANPAVPPDLPNRAARRRWARQHRHLHHTKPAGTNP